MIWLTNPNHPCMYVMDFGNGNSLKAVMVFSAAFTVLFPTPKLVILLNCNLFRFITIPMLLHSMRKEQFSKKASLKLDVIHTLDDPVKPFSVSIMRGKIALRQNALFRPAPWCNEGGDILAVYGEPVTIISLQASISVLKVLPGTLLTLLKREVCDVSVSC